MTEFITEGELRVLPRPPAFSGKATGTEWKEWRFKTAAYLGAYHPQAAQLLKEASTYPEPIKMSTEYPWVARLSRMIYTFLAIQVSGKAMTVVESVSDSNGFEAWRRLPGEYEPNIWTLRLRC